MIKQISLLIIGSILGAAMYDLAIHMKISYNRDVLKIYCVKDKLYEQIQADVDVFVYDNKECKTEKGIHNDNRNPTQNPS